jgi:hypothetical protein
MVMKNPYRYNPYQYRISKERYEEFLKHLVWQRLQSPDYRFGQAFLNFFPEISQMMYADGDLGNQAEQHLFYEEWEPIARTKCEQWVDQ